MKAKGGASCLAWNIFKKKSELSEESGSKNIKAISVLENMSCEKNLKEEFSQSSEEMYNNLQINQKFCRKQKIVGLNCDKHDF